MSDRKDAPPAAKDQRAEPSLVELIAQTPGAQTREQALAHIKARQQKCIKKPLPSAPSEEQLATPEPFPIIDNPEQHAANFWKRFNAKEEEKRKPPKRSKPRLLIDNDKPNPSGKK